MTQSRDLFNIYNRQKMQNTADHIDHKTEYVHMHTLNRQKWGVISAGCWLLNNPLYNLESILLCTFCRVIP